MNHARLFRQKFTCNVLPAPLGPAMIMQRGDERADLLMVGRDANFSVLMKQGGTPCAVQVSMFKASALDSERKLPRFENSRNIEV